MTISERWIGFSDKRRGLRHNSIASIYVRVLRMDGPDCVCEYVTMSIDIRLSNIPVLFLHIRQFFPLFRSLSLALALSLSPSLCVQKSLLFLRRRRNLGIFLSQRLGDELLDIFLEGRCGQVSLCVEVFPYAGRRGDFL